MPNATLITPPVVMVPAQGGLVCWPLSGETEQDLERRLKSVDLLASPAEAAT